MRYKFSLKDRIEEQFDKLEERIVTKLGSKRDVSIYNTIVWMTTMLGRKNA